jgi:hypothetical protein
MLHFTSKGVKAKALLKEVFVFHSENFHHYNFFYWL